MATEQAKAARELENQIQEQRVKTMEYENRMRMAQDQVAKQKLESEMKAQIALMQATAQHNLKMQEERQLQMKMDHQRKMELAEADLARMKKEELRLKEQHEEEIRRERREAEERMKAQAEFARQQQEHQAEMSADRLRETEERANARVEGLDREMAFKLRSRDEEHAAKMELQNVRTTNQMDMVKAAYENTEKELRGDITRCDEKIQKLEADNEKSEAEKKQLMLELTDEKDLRQNQLEEFKKKMLACQSQLMIQYGGTTQKRLELQALMSEIIPEVEHNNQYKWMPPPLWVGLYSAFFALLSIRTGEMSMILNGIILGIILYAAFIYYYFDQGRMLVLKLREGKGIADQIVQSERTVFGSMEAMTGIKIDVPSNPFDILSMETLCKQIADREVMDLGNLYQTAQNIKSDTIRMHTSRDKLLSIEMATTNDPKKQAITDAPSF